MLKVVCSNNTAIFRELRSPAFQALDLQQVVVTTGPEAIEVTRRERPGLVVLDVDLPEMSGYDVCARIKGDPALHETRVILVVTGGPSPVEVDRLAACGCDDIMTIPLPADDLYTHAARLLALPARVRAHVRAQITLPPGSPTPVLRGEATSIKLDTIELNVEQKIDVATEIKLRLTRTGTGQAVVVKGKVLACDANKDSGLTLRVKLTALRPEDERMLADLALWEVQEKGAGLVVTLRGDITERTEFTTLRAALEPVRDVSFDLGGVRYLNSTGIRRWVDFLASLPADLSYSFVRCSVAFVTQLGQVGRASGRARIVSFHAPYRCDTCDRETEQLLQTQSLSIPVGKNTPAPPFFVCTQCGNPLELDEMPERFFAFMQRGA